MPLEGHGEQFNAVDAEPFASTDDDVIQPGIVPQRLILLLEDQLEALHQHLGGHAPLSALARRCRRAV
jgi:hypothetical protein